MNENRYDENVNKMLNIYIYMKQLVAYEEMNNNNVNYFIQSNESMNKQIHYMTLMCGYL